MPHEKITPQSWILLPKEIREHLAIAFNVGRSSHTEIRDSEVITDGRTMSDLEAISKEKMTEYVGSEESFGRLWDLTIAKAHSELNPPVGVIQVRTAKPAHLSGEQWEELTRKTVINKDKPKRKAKKA